MYVEGTEVSTTTMDDIAHGNDLTTNNQYTANNASD